MVITTRKKTKGIKETPSADVRRAVLDGALEIIASQGPDALSMREVARQAGVSHQAPYHYFGDRAGILTAIAEEGFTQFTTSFTDAFRGADEPLIEALKAYVSFALEHPGHYRVMFRSDISGVINEDSPAHRAADRAFDALLELAETVDPSSRDDETLMLPISLWAHAHGLSTLFLDGPLASKLPPDTSIDDFIARIGNFFSGGINVSTH